MPRNHVGCTYTIFVAGSLLAGAPAVGPSLHAQTLAPDAPQVDRALMLHMGQWHGDVRGTVAAVRAELPLGRNGYWLIVPGVTYSHYSLREAPTPVVDVLVPEALLHFQLRRGGWFRPYVGGGAGVALINMFHTFDPVVTIAAGMRADITPHWGARLNVETRAFGFQAESVGWSVGFARHF